MNAAQRHQHYGDIVKAVAPAHSVVSLGYTAQFRLSFTFSHASSGLSEREEHAEVAERLLQHVKPRAVSTGTRTADATSASSENALLSEGPKPPGFRTSDKHKDADAGETLGRERHRAVANGDLGEAAGRRHILPHIAL